MDTVHKSPTATVPPPSSRSYLDGEFAPVTEEVTAFDLPVSGSLPPELDGRYLRIGPNPKNADPATYHWFTGEGMVHGVRLRDGRCEWYRNRWTSTPDAVFPPNTNVIGIGSRTFAIVEAFPPPVELSFELDPIGVATFDGTLTGSYTAHPKLDPATGIFHAVTYLPSSPAVHYVAVGSDARVIHDVEIPLADSPMVHDTAITESKALVFDMPVTFDPAVGGGLSFAWQSDRAARIGVLPLLGLPGQIAWCEAPTSYVFHPLNAFDLPDGRVVVDVAKWPKAFDRSDPHGPGAADTTLVRWTLDPATGSVSEVLLSERPQEFPRVNESVVGRRHRYGYTVGGVIGDTAAVLKHDLDAGSVEAWEPGSDWFLSEAVFVPSGGEMSPGQAEDDGWLMLYAHDRSTATSSFVVLAAQDIAAGPVASVELPQRVPAGFHGNWIAAR